MDKRGAESVGQNCRLDPTSAYRVALRKRTARNRIDMGLYCVHEVPVDTFYTVALRIPFATTYNVCSISVSVDRNR